MDRAVARGDVAGFRHRRAPGAQQHRDGIARHVHQLANRVCGADGDVQHHRRRLSRDAVVAVRHRHREIFMRRGDEARVLASAAVARNRLDDRREIGAGIGEDIVDAAFAEPGEKRFRGKIGRGQGSVGNLVHGSHVSIVRLFADLYAAIKSWQMSRLCPHYALCVYRGTLAYRTGARLHPGIRAAGPSCLQCGLRCVQSTID